jgi:general secretion pathway protein E/type IV pilus assembly protein PilB
MDDDEENMMALNPFARPKTPQPKKDPPDDEPREPVAPAQDAFASPQPAPAGLEAESAQPPSPPPSHPPVAQEEAAQSSAPSAMEFSLADPPPAPTQRPLSPQEQFASAAMQQASPSESAAPAESAPRPSASFEVSALEQLAEDEDEDELPAQPAAMASPAPSFQQQLADAADPRPEPEAPAPSAPAPEEAVWALDTAAIQTPAEPLADDPAAEAAPTETGGLNTPQATPQTSPQEDFSLELPAFAQEKKPSDEQATSPQFTEKSTLDKEKLELQFADSIETAMEDKRGLTSLHTDRHQKVHAQPEATPPPPSPADENNKSERKKPRRIGERLIEHGLISDDQLQVALQEQKRSKKLIGAILVDMGFITESTLGEVLAESSGTKKFDAKSTVLDPELTQKIPKQVAARHKIIPVSLQGNVLTVATPDVYNVLALDQIKRHFDRGITIDPIYCAESEVLELVEKYYEYELSIDGILQEIETGIREKGEIDAGEDGYTNPTVRLVNAILIDAIHRGASDIHFEPEGQFLRLRYRIDGDLEQIRSFHRDYWQAVAVRIKILSSMNIAESRMPQDGRINFAIMGREVDFRVATQPTVHGENIVMRLLDKTKSLVPLGQLGFADHSITLLKRLLKRPEGIIIVTGPTGSGKTTTLYSILNYINSIGVNIMTLEDPVEYQLSLIRQSNVQEGTVDFANGIKSLMRQDPDIIFIGEVRDEKTALMTIRAALTGHQVFTTLHTNDALGAIPRLNDIGVPSHLLAGSLIASMAQRLARRLCPSCKKPRLAKPDEARILGYMPEDPPTIYEPVGCSDCGGKGYKGRIAIIEILSMDEGMNELIATSATRSMMMEYALENGFVSMMEDGIDKVINGDIDLKQLIETVDMTERL